MESYNFTNCIVLVAVVWLSSIQFYCRTSVLVQAEAVCLPASSCSEFLSKTNTPQKCIPDSTKECLGISTGKPPAAKLNSSEVEVCLWGRSGYQPCTNLPGESDADEATVDLSSVTASIVSHDPRHFMVNASWAIEASSLSITGRYQVKLLGHGRFRRERACVCIKNSIIRNYSFTGWEYIGNGDRTLSVEVTPYPLPPDVVRDNRKIESEQLERPTGCADAIIDNTLCNTKIYGESENLTVLSCLASDGTKRLKIDWLPPSIPAGAPLPHTYYLQIHRRGGARLHSFKVINTTSVEVRNLNASLDYEARLQSYRRCSGVGNHFIRDGGIDFLGCGRTATAEEIPSVCAMIMPTTTAMPTAIEETTPPITTPADVNTTADAAIAPSTLHIYLVSLPVFFMVSAIVAIVTICAILAVKYCPCHPYPGGIPPGPKDFKVFVFYCSSTPEGDVEYIQKHVVSALSQYFEVHSLNDFPRGDMSAGIEEAVRSSDKVLLVCNQELCREWGKGHDRDPALNSMHLLISAAVSSNNIDKFGIVLTKKGQKETCIPNDSYVKLMPVFSVKEGSDLSNLYRFVTCSRTFELSSTRNTPTSVALEHVAGWCSSTGNTPTSDGHEVHLTFLQCSSTDSTPTSELPEHAAVRSTFQWSVSERPEHVAVCSTLLQCSSTDSTPTSEGPEHVAVSE